MTTATTTLNDTLVKLEDLYTAYKALLTDAQGQLESFSLGETEIKQIINSLQERPVFQREVAESLLSQVSHSIRIGDQELFESWRASHFMNLLTDKILTTLKQELEPLIKDQVKEVVNSGIIERMIADKINESDKIETSLTVLNNLEAALKPIIAKQIEQ